MYSVWKRKFCSLLWIRFLNLKMNLFRRNLNVGEWNTQCWLKPCQSAPCCHSLFTSLPLFSFYFQAHWPEPIFHMVPLTVGLSWNTEVAQQEQKKSTVCEVGILIRERKGIKKLLRAQWLQTANPVISEVLSCSQSLWNSLQLFPCYF